MRQIKAHPLKSKVNHCRHFVADISSLDAHRRRRIHILASESSVFLLGLRLLSDSAAVTDIYRSRASVHPHPYPCCSPASRWRKASRCTGSSSCRRWSAVGKRRGTPLIASRSKISPLQLPLMSPPTERNVAEAGVLMSSAAQPSTMSAWCQLLETEERCRRTELHFLAHRSMFLGKLLHCVRCDTLRFMHTDLVFNVAHEKHSSVAAPSGFGR